MRLGCYGSLDQASQFKTAGFDFMEVDAQAVLRGDQPSSAWDAGSIGADRSPLPIEAASRLMPSRLPIVGPGRDMVELQNYVQRITNRARQLGIQCLILDSDATRVPQGQADERIALRQLEEFVRMAGQMCAHHHLTFAIEASGDDGGDTISRLDQIGPMCHRVNHRCVGVAANSGCLQAADCSEQEVLKLGDRLRYVRLSNLQGLTQSKPSGSDAADGSDMEDFFCLLHKVGYDGRITLGGVDGGQASDETVRLLRAAWDRSGGFNE